MGGKEELIYRWLNKLLFLCKRIKQIALAGYMKIQSFLLGTSKICVYAFAIRMVRMIAEAENRSGLCDSRKRKWIADFFLQRGFLLSILKK